MPKEADLSFAITVIIPIYNSTQTLERCLEAVYKSNYSNYDCVVVDDGSTDNYKEIVNRYPVKCHTIENGPKGPAYARNVGANLAKGDILLFIDSDVILYPDTIDKVCASFAKDPLLDALFGSYDEEPGDGEFISQYKNLTHRFVHLQSKEGYVSTFWSGCGAIRRDVFLNAGGFDTVRYSRPSIEDIDLGARLKATGHRIQVNKDVVVKHLKRWTLPSLIRTDVVDRGIPWTRLILRQGEVPDELNLGQSQRISSVLALILLAYLGFLVLKPGFLLILLTMLQFLFIVNLRNWGERKVVFLKERSKVLLTLLCMLITGLGGYIGGIDLLVVLVTFSLVLFLLLIFIPNKNNTFSQFLYVSLLTMNLLQISLLFWVYSSLLWLPIVLILVLIVGLNYRLYTFYVKQRGFIFALAAIPFQVLYYWYSVLAFLIGVGLFYLDTQVKPRFAPRRKSISN